MKNYLFTLVALVAFRVAVNAQNKKIEELPLPHKVTDLSWSICMAKPRNCQCGGRRIC